MKTVEELEKELQPKIGNLVARCTNLEGAIADISNWRDPRNTQGKFDNISHLIESLTMAIGKLTERIVKLEKKPADIVETIKESENIVIKKRLGRPPKNEKSNI